MTEVGEQASERATPTPKLVIALDRPRNGHACRVEAPARVLRMRGALNAANDELHQAARTPAALQRLQRSLQVIRMELERSVSAPLAAELRDLVPVQATSPSVDELRIECASLLGWTGGLAVGILEQLEATAVASTQTGAAGARPERSHRAAAPAA